MAGVSGSTEAAEELQKKVRETVLGMKQVMEDFDQDLKRLRFTAKDESYEQALYYYRITLREIQTLLPQMADVIRRLDRYISFIEKVELRISSPASVSSGRSSASASSFHTREVFKVTDKGVIYDDPEKTGRNMRHRQTRGDCGLCSIENLTIMAGRHVSLADIAARAGALGLCDADGGTTYSTRERLLGEFGISSHSEEQTIEGIAAAVAGGRGVIISVNSAKLSAYGYKGGICLRNEPHALLVTGIATDGNGNVTHVAVCDSNADALGLSGATWYPVSEIQKALKRNGKMNVTDYAVR